MAVIKVKPKEKKITFEINLLILTEIFFNIILGVKNKFRAMQNLSGNGLVILIIPLKKLKRQMRN